MEEVSLANQSYSLIQKDFDTDESIIDGDLSFEQILTVLESAIQSMLDHDFNRLLNAIYRIDLAPSTFKNILESSKPEELAKDLAIVILERQKQKVILRNKYKS